MGREASQNVRFISIKQKSENSNGILGPLAPGKTKTYTFRCTQQGTTWYHSHYSSQYGMGVFGGLIINGPASANYDTDLGTYTVNDWYYQTAFQIQFETDADLQRGAGPPPANTILINGTNKNANGGGSYGRVVIESGKRYLLRLINTSLDNQIRVSLDGHPFTVITSDLVPIHPYNTNWILLGIGMVIIFFVAGTDNSPQVNATTLFSLRIKPWEITGFGHRQKQPVSAPTMAPVKASSAIQVQPLVILPAPAPLSLQIATTKVL